MRLDWGCGIMHSWLICVARYRIGAAMQDNDFSSPIGVLLADDHTMFRQGLASVLATYGGIEVVPR